MLTIGTPAAITTGAASAAVAGVKVVILTISVWGLLSFCASLVVGSLVSSWWSIGTLASPVTTAIGNMGGGAVGAAFGNASDVVRVEFGLMDLPRAMPPGKDNTTTLLINESEHGAPIAGKARVKRGLTPGQRARCAKANAATPADQTTWCDETWTILDLYVNWRDTWLGFVASWLIRIVVFVICWLLVKPIWILLKGLWNGLKFTVIMGWYKTATYTGYWSADTTPPPILADPNWVGVGLCAVVGVLVAAVYHIYSWRIWITEEHQAHWKEVWLGDGILAPKIEQPVGIPRGRAGAAFNKYDHEEIIADAISQGYALQQICLSNEGRLDSAAVTALGQQPTITTTTILNASADAMCSAISYSFTRIAPGAKLLAVTVTPKGMPATMSVECLMAKSCTKKGLVITLYHAQGHTPKSLPLEALVTLEFRADDKHDRNVLIHGDTGFVRIDNAASMHKPDPAGNNNVATAALAVAATATEARMDRMEARMTRLDDNVDKVIAFMSKRHKRGKRVVVDDDESSSDSDVEPEPARASSKSKNKPAAAALAGLNTSRSNSVDRSKSTPSAAAAAAAPASPPGAKSAAPKPGAKGSG
jgi:hypothetical protein